MKADVVVRGALESVLQTRSKAFGNIFAIGATDAPLDVILLPEDSPWNRGILLRERDVAIVDGPVHDGWLEELLREFDASDRIASVSKGSATLLRHWVLNVIGGLDATDALAEWQARAQRLGLVSKRLS